MALLREDFAVAGKLDNFRGLLQDEAEGAPDDEGLPEAPEAVDDGVSVSIPGLDPRLRPVGVVGRSKAVAS